MATTKEELLVLGIYYMWSRIAAALAWRGALSSSPFPILDQISFINQHHCNPTQVVVIGESPCVTNNNYKLFIPNIGKTLAV